MPKDEKQDTGAVSGKDPAIADLENLVQKLTINNQQLTAQNEELTAAINKQLQANDALQKELNQLRGSKTLPAVSLKGTHIRVAAVSDGYFRGGIQFSRTAQELEIKALSKAQLDAIRSDERLVVVDL